mgnify:CR=1 FL=1
MSGKTDKLLEFVREKEAVGTIDLEEADEKLRQCRSRQEDAKKELAMYCQSIENHRNAIREYDAAVRGIQISA